jgi:hypothetical protein
MASTHVVTTPAQLPRRQGLPDRADVRRELIIAAALFLAVLIAEAAFIFATAQYIPAASTIFATVT